MYILSKKYNILLNSMIFCCNIRIALERPQTKKQERVMLYVASYKCQLYSHMHV